MLPHVRTYDELIAQFRWQIPARFNIGVAACDVWAAREPDRVALIAVDASGGAEHVSYGALRERSNRLANALRALGVAPGERVAILLPQSTEVAVAHLAIAKLGAMSLPLAVLFGIDALAYRLRDAGAKIVITNAAGADKVNGLRDTLPEVRSVLSLDGAGDGAQDFHATLARASSDFTSADTSPDDPAMIIYTSGTTGQPKGAVHGHRVLLGHIPGVQFHHEFVPQPGDRLWTPADWAWAGGLLNVLLPGLYLGVPVVAKKFERFDPEAAFDLMARHSVRNAFIPPTALRMLRAAASPRGRHDIKLRTIGSGGESLGVEAYEWGREALGVTINEFYGQTECNLVLGACSALGVSRPGAIGKPVPGHRVGVIREDGTPCEPEETGQIVMGKGDPVMFLGYWNKPDATRDKFIGDWMTTGDQGAVDGDGYVRFVGRDDDVITSSGYRIGPGEIEDCLIQHPAVALAAAVGKPDAVRTEIVKAFVVLKAGHAPTPETAADIQTFVRKRLSGHEYPREVAFLDELPMTTTGKVIRRLLREKV